MAVGVDHRLRQREPRYESEKLRRLCHKAPLCFIRVPGVCTGGPTECVHSDSQAHGRGTGNKTHDFNTLPGCRACHDHYARNQSSDQALVDDGIERWRWYIHDQGWVRYA